MRRADLGQHPEGLRVLLLQLFARPLRVGQGGVAHRADSDLEAVVLRTLSAARAKECSQPKSVSTRSSRCDRPRGVTPRRAGKGRR